MPVIDVHSHVAVPAAQELASRTRTLRDEPMDFFVSAATRARPHKPLRALVDPELRLEQMAAWGVDIQVISPSPSHFCYWATPEIGARIAELVNDGMVDFAASVPDRFVPFGTLPLQDPAVAADELDRALARGIRGFEIGTDVAGMPLSRAGLDDLFAKLAASDVLVLVHPNGYPEAAVLSHYYLVNIVGNPLATTVAAYYLILDGVLERLPNLRLCFVHGGGYAGSYPGRLAHAFRARDDVRAGGSKADPATTLARCLFDTVVHDPLQLEFLVRRFGASRLLLGSDYPFDMGQADPVAFVADARLSSKERNAILGANAADVLGSLPAANASPARVP